MLRVAVVANDYLSRTGLVSLLEGERLSVPVASSTIDEAADALGSHELDVIVWAWEGRGEGPRLPPELTVPILLLLPSEIESEDRDLPADELPLLGLRANVAGVVSREASADQLAAAVAAVAAGLYVVQPEFDYLFASAISGPFAYEQLRIGENDLPLEPLTAREVEVLGLLADGLSNKRLAARLEVSEHTIKFHLNSLFDKLAAHNRTEAVSTAVRLGLIAL
ncbi:MAG TPA: response regulator transcription factor [Trueperaceae bacterium]